MSFGQFPNDPGLGIGLVQAGTLVDILSWGQSQTGINYNLNGTGNQFGMSIQVNDTIATGGGPYEKAGLLIIAQTNDPSTVNNNDMVGIDSRAYGASTNTLSRLFGGYDEARILAGGDGLAIGHETQSNNSGTDQPAIATTTSKYGYHAVAAGPNPSTAAHYIGGVPRGAAASKWHKGLVMETAALASGASDSFLELTSTWRVNAASGQVGQTIIGSATPASTTTLLEVIAPNSAADPFIQFGNSANSQPYSLRGVNAGGAGAVAIASGGGFLSDATLGDFVMTIFTAGKSVRIGGNATVMSVSRANALGYFGTAGTVRNATAFTNTAAQATSFDLPAAYTLTQLGAVVVQLIKTLGSNSGYGLVQATTNF